MKKIVHYRELEHCVVGQNALVFPIDHPDSERISNKKLVMTSVVQSVNPETGEFETLNTIYKKASPSLLAEAVALSELVEAAPDLSFENADELKNAEAAGCYSCLRIFPVHTINEWTDEGKTALCPVCSIDSVIAQTAERTLSTDLLVKMTQRWFCGRPTLEQSAAIAKALSTGEGSAESGAQAGSNV